MALRPQRQTHGCHPHAHQCKCGCEVNEEEGGGKQAVADLSFAELFGSHVLILLVKVSIVVHGS